MSPLESPEAKWAKSRVKKELFFSPAASQWERAISPAKFKVFSLYWIFQEVLLVDEDTEFGEIPKVKPKELLIINDRIVKSICQAVVASSTGGQWQDK